jgi:hypothetical protein
MMKRTRPARLLLLIATTLWMAVPSGCTPSPSADSDPGPVHSWQVHGTPFASAGTLGVYRGQVTDFAAFLVNDAKAPVTVTSATLIPMPGHPVGRLVHVAVQTGKNPLVIDRNWPPEGVSLQPLIGARLPRGHVPLAAGYTTPRTGTYATAGLLITYRTGGRTYHAHAWGGAVSCIPPGHPASPPACHRSDQLTNQVMAFIHRQ